MRALTHTGGHRPAPETMATNQMGSYSPTAPHSFPARATLLPSIVAAPITGQGREPLLN